VIYDFRHEWGVLVTIVCVLNGSLKG